jgi:hypothetical protein
VGDAPQPSEKLATYESLYQSWPPCDVQTLQKDGLYKHVRYSDVYVTHTYVYIV